MNDERTSEVNGVQSSRAEKPASPHPVGERVVHEERPESDEEQVAPKVHSPDERARDEGWRDDGEHHLKRHEQERWNRGGEDRRRRPNSPQHEELEPSDDTSVVRAEGNGIAHHDPQN